MATTPATTTPSAGRRPGFAGLQRLGTSLMLPIALLPAAGILLRLGQDDLLGKIDTPIIGPFFDAMSAGGDAIFKNLALLFAVGVAIGFARKADGSTALSAVAGYLVLDGVFTAMSPVILAGQMDQAGNQAMISYNVLGGIIVGLITAWLFDRYHEIQLPTYLGFFGGRRFVPIVVSLATLVVGFAMSYFYPIFATGLTATGKFIAGSGIVGAFLYGFANRMLIPFGLHHILNSFIWFIYGDYNTGTAVVTGELTRFAAGDPTGGHLTSGFYPILMFGLPGAALAMMHVARPEQKKAAAGILGAAGLTAFLTGITEPLEFAFMFAAFPLYVLHAILTGVSMAIAYALDIHLGFSFSAGLFDLLLYGTAPAAKNIPLLVSMGVGFFVLYYVLFRFAITKWNMRTPGRGDVQAVADDGTHTTGRSATGGGRAEALIEAFGGRDNLRDVDACITRLRIEVVDKARVSKDKLMALGAAGVVEVGNNVQAVFGPQADALKTDIRAALAGWPATGIAPTPTAVAAHREAAHPGETVVLAPVAGRVVPLSEVPDATFAQGLVGHGLAIDPRHENVDVVAPVSGTVVQSWPHAFAIETKDGTGVLVHLGLDTVRLEGRGFVTHVGKGATVRAGELMTTYDVPAVRAAGHASVVPVVVLEAKGEDIRGEAGREVARLDELFTAHR
ncbi:glucose PTS transporter subunit IIA [Mobilicoccus pelagius]|uniref:Putative glucose-specific phosphotransferase system enzyme EIICBA component n=1 Tax=Mobilicoccus pelagius NBRC 104925 TaxID=1089455 RepID=H5UVY6_9MICO|nr:glucose PTS transporter subunit IIA [Mobilicoccus pelagius]GAB49894.1 putative glucose-specific phosphotransferase system enzyme EIICBA component [Mobilicoccus pelagius NBRC 104925]